MTFICVSIGTGDQYRSFTHKLITRFVLLLSSYVLLLLFISSLLYFFMFSTRCLFFSVLFSLTASSLSLSTYFALTIGLLFLPLSFYIPTFFLQPLCSHRTGCSIEKIIFQKLTIAFSLFFRKISVNPPNFSEDFHLSSSTECPILHCHGMREENRKYQRKKICSFTRRRLEERCPPSRTLLTERRKK